MGLALCVVSRDYPRYVDAPSRELLRGAERRRPLLLATRPRISPDKTPGHINVVAHERAAMPLYEKVDRSKMVSLSPTTGML